MRATDVATEVVLVAQLSLRECITSSRAKTSEFQLWCFGLLVTADSLGVSKSARVVGGSLSGTHHRSIQTQKDLNPPFHLSPHTPSIPSGHSSVVRQ